MNTGSGQDPPGTWEFVYDQSGRQVQRYTGGPSGYLWQGDIYAGSRHLVRVGYGSTKFVHSDWLGSERVHTSYTGTVCETIASLPFGDGISTTGSCGRSAPLYLTGKYRDSESNLDYFGARYDSSSLGRFMSPDPGNIAGELDESANPQSWNAYSYVFNNPINATDPDGLDCVYAGDYNNSGTVLIERGNKCTYVSGTYVSGTVGEKSLVYDQKTNQLSFSFSDPQNQTGGAGIISLGPPRSEGISDSDRFNAPRMGVGLGEQGVNWAMRTTAANAIGAAGGYLLGRGIQAILAAREATAAAEAVVDLQNLSPKISGQMVSRGWTKEAIVDTIQEAQEAGTTYPAVNKSTGGPATEYVSQSTGKFVVVDNTIKEVIQVSRAGYKPNYLLKP